MFVEMIEDHDLAIFEDRINGLIKYNESKGYEVVDIKYGYAPATIVGFEYSAMIIYKESE